MRQIKFRGKRVDNGEWVYGLLVYLNKIRVFYDHSFVDENGSKVEYQTTEDIQVDPDTVGQFTGLLDKNGKEIWEGDVISGGVWDRYVVEWDAEKVGWNISNPVQHYFEVIGNIHDNPSLLTNK